MSSEHSGRNEASFTPPKTIVEKAYQSSSNCLSNLGERIASRSIGQVMFRKIDDIFWTFEKAIEWSDPPAVKEVAQSTDTTTGEPAVVNGSAKKDIPGKLVRPLPWVFFIPLLFVIRGLRFCVDTTFKMLKKDQIQPKDMVRYIQGMRRRARVIKFRGFRNMGKQGDVNVKEKSNASLTLIPPFKTTVTDVDGSAGKRSALNQDQIQEKRKFAEIDPNSSDDDDEENVNEKLNRLGQEPDDSENDPDFVPDLSEESIDESISSDESGDDSVNRTLIAMKNGIPRQASTISNDIIEEEPEDDEESSTVSISEDEDEDEDNEEEEDEVIVNNKLSASVDKDKFFSPVQSDGEVDLCEPNQFVVLDSNSPENNKPKEDVSVQPFDVTKSDYESSSLSMSIKSEEVISTNLSEIEISDHSQDSAMKKFSNFFPKRKKSTSQNSV